MAGLILYVRTAAGVVPVDIDPSATVGDLRQQVEAQRLVPKGCRLAVGGRVLQDDAVHLSDTGVSAQCTLSVHEDRRAEKWYWCTEGCAMTDQTAALSTQGDHVFRAGPAAVLAAVPCFEAAVRFDYTHESEHFSHAMGFVSTAVPSDKITNVNPIAGVMFGFRSGAVYCYDSAYGEDECVPSKDFPHDFTEGDVLFVRWAAPDFLVECVRQGQTDREELCRYRWKPAQDEEYAFTLYMFTDAKYTLL
eukprot:TRINITY_DN497_c0_g1_i1.p1 TRINITY_DN497_c0_g1~~TRINITY_DN497_c0_g1_i1.p1  ORF type:complete len:271 (+),score=74.22 TRINITY_DN497_c0_g1_i1:72-815(+)